MTKINLMTHSEMLEAAPIREQTLDQEWVSLIQTARELGMTIEEIRKFLAEAAASGQHDEQHE